MPSLVDFNKMSVKDAEAELFRCCGSRRWAEQMAIFRPFPDEKALFTAAQRIWLKLTSEDWYEAFKQHPRIGGATKSAWTKQEQEGVKGAPPRVLESLKKGNEAYEKKFGFIFLVCATGKTAKEMSVILKERLQNDPRTELGVAVREQAKIVKIRLEKMLQS